MSVAPCASLSLALGQDSLNALCLRGRYSQDASDIREAWEGCVDYDPTAHRTLSLDGSKSPCNSSANRVHPAVTLRPFTFARMNSMIESIGVPG